MHPVGNVPNRDLMFGPLGFVCGGYGITLGLFGVLRQKRQAFLEQRAQLAAGVLDRVFVGPLRDVVERVASEADLSALEAHCDAIEAESI